ncbi:STAS domain-containing protein [Melioribacter sp. Ez-97]|uniref:STAS domain-containing protein n=1 Tax=Melioribacter sp. Ez-97 TaxID=3423434 RepID=UPI003EDB5CA0
MEFKSEKFEDVTVVYVYLKRATLAKAVKFKEFVMELIDQGSHKVIIDLTICEYIDSTFLGAMVSLLKKINSIQGDLRLVYNKEAPSLVFVITRMDKVFKIFDTLDEALDSFGIKRSKPGLDWVN